MDQKRRKKAQDMMIESQMQMMARDDVSLPPNLLPADFPEYVSLLRDIPGLNPSQRRFLGAFAMCGVISRSAVAARVGTRMHKQWMADPVYRDAFMDAQEISNDYLESLAFDLASGVKLEPMVSMGKVVTYKQIHDTRLLGTLLKARMPDKYGTKVDITSNGHSIVKVIDKDTYDSI